MITAIKDKALKIGALPKLFDLLDALQDNVKTNMTLNDIKTFGGVANKISSDATHHVSIDNTNWQYDTTSADGQYILLPRDHTLTYLHNFLGAEMVDPAVLAEKANIQFASTPGQASQGREPRGIWAALLHGSTSRRWRRPRAAPPRPPPRSTTTPVARTPRQWPGCSSTSTASSS